MGKIKATEKVLGIKLLEVATGGKGRGGGNLDTEAKELISKYKKYTDRMAFLMEKEFKHIFGKRNPFRHCIYVRKFQRRG